MRVLKIICSEKINHLKWMKHLEPLRLCEWINQCEKFTILEWITLVKSIRSIKWIKQINQKRIEWISWSKSTYGIWLNYSSRITYSKLMNYENWTKSKLSNESVPKRQSSYLYESQQINHLKIREWIESGKLFSEAKWINLYEYLIVREWIYNLRTI